MFDLMSFKKKVQEFDQRLASIINQAFQDVSSCEEAFKVIVHCQSIGDWHRLNLI